VVSDSWFHGWVVCRYWDRAPPSRSPKFYDFATKIGIFFGRQLFHAVWSLAVVPQGGNTGLVGGSVPVFDEVVISLSRMNKIESFDRTNGVVVCQAGVVSKADILFQTQVCRFLKLWINIYWNTISLCLSILALKAGISCIRHVFPCSLYSCQIGGNIATNAGGIRLLRYGSLHGNIMGLEVVRSCLRFAFVLTLLGSSWWHRFGKLEYVTKRQHRIRPKAVIYRLWGNSWNHNSRCHSNPSKT